MTDGFGGTRRDIATAIARFPGIHLRGLERETQLASSLLLYHLKDMEDAGEIVAREINGYTRYFPGPQSAGPHLDPHDQVVLSVLREKVPFEVAMHLLEARSLKHKDLAERLGISKSTVTYHLRKMGDLGIVVKTPRGEEKGFALVEPERVRILLREYRPTPEMLDEFSSLWDDFYGSR